MTLTEPFYDLPEVSKKLGNCSRSTIYRLIEAGKLVRRNLGTKAIITGASLAQCIDELNSTESAARTAYIEETKSKLAEKRKTAEYICWKGLRQRCLNPNDFRFKNYGGRGIKVCDRWLESYENFLADMGRKPSASHSIDRIDNDGDYEPGNCRWATLSEQSRNRRKAIGRKPKLPMI